MAYKCNLYAFMYCKFFGLSNKAILNQMSKRCGPMNWKFSLETLIIDWRRNANFKKLSAENRTQILEIFQKHLKELKLIVRKDNDEAIAVMQKQGLELIQTSPDQVTEFKILSDKAMQKLAGKSFTEKVINEITSSLEAFRKNRQ